MEQKKKSVRIVLWLAFIFYILAVGYLCFSPTLPLVIPANNPVPYIYLGKAPFIWLPFAEMLDIQFYLNVLMTVPFGVFTALLVRKPLSLWRSAGLGIVVGGLIESTQLILDNLQLTSRWVDINDVIANALGVFAGYLVLVWIKGVIQRCIHGADGN
ncbi:membrane protein [Ligilactobacillus salitolerans]|uniref:Membrane protein n=1 Tax=Ligilactobacillus salitolerans TaxID=1808352 RepID=A0A401IT33_9LACO|nr:VanZ family protein [Ligilactobacillus salitolerans]GBG94688.1 membrane protein [Ligilactobacillus salitolerans]